MAFNDRESIPQLMLALSDSHVLVRWRAAKALDSFGWSPANATQAAQHAVAAGEYSRAVTMGAAAVAPLTAALRDQHSHTRHGALDALAQIEDERVFPLVLEALQDRDAHVRVAAAEVLSEFPDPKTIAALVMCLGDGNVLLRAAAAGSLGKLGDVRAVEPLIAVLRDPDWSVRKAAVDALGLLRAGAAVQPLSSLLGDPDSDVREAVSVAFGRIGDRRAIEGLVASLADGQVSVRQATAAALRRIDPDWARSPEARRAIPRLEASLQHRDYWVRHAAAAALSGLRAADEVETSLRQGHDRVLFRRQAVLETLLSALEDEDRDLRLAAVEALGRMGESDAAGRLRPLLDDPDPWIRSSVRTTLQSFEIASTALLPGRSAAGGRGASREPDLTLN
jgi:HEAT repeat protein